MVLHKVISSRQRFLKYTSTLIISYLDPNCVIFVRYISNNYTLISKSAQFNKLYSICVIACSYICSVLANRCLHPLLVRDRALGCVGAPRVVLSVQGARFDTGASRLSTDEHLSTLRTTHSRCGSEQITNFIACRWLINAHKLSEHVGGVYMYKSLSKLKIISIKSIRCSCMYTNRLYIIE